MCRIIPDYLKNPGNNPKKTTRRPPEPTRQGKHADDDRVLAALTAWRIHQNKGNPLEYQILEFYVETNRSLPSIGFFNA